MKGPLGGLQGSMQPQFAERDQYGDGNSVRGGVQGVDWIHREGWSEEKRLSGRKGL